MRDDLAGPVYEAFSAGLDLRERLETAREMPPDFQKEQSNLRELVRKIPNLGEEKSGGERFLGVRYPIVCWLDEIFILDSRWKSAWTEASLEMALYDSRDRAWNFWEQARLAESRVSIDALEVFFLCAMLGFRGDWHNKPERLRDWFQATRGLLLNKQQRRWTAPNEVQPPTYVPPLTAAKKKHQMLRAWAVSLLVVIPLATFFFVFQVISSIKRTP
jgi:type IV/VI secretion system ImpK/VasF family protein